MTALGSWARKEKESRVSLNLGFSTADWILPSFGSGWPQSLFLWSRLGHVHSTHLPPDLTHGTLPGPLTFSAMLPLTAGLVLIIPPAITYQPGLPSPASHGTFFCECLPDCLAQARQEGVWSLLPNSRGNCLRQGRSLPCVIQWYRAPCCRVGL